MKQKMINQLPADFLNFEFPAQQSIFFEFQRRLENRTTKKMFTKSKILNFKSSLLNRKCNGVNHQNISNKFWNCVYINFETFGANVT